MRILCVDDCAVARYSVRKALRERGVDVVEAQSWSDGKQALSDDFDAALFDIDLGDGSGINLAELLIKSNKNCPIAFLSSCEEEDELRQARRFGGVFSKVSGLQSALEWLLARAHSYQAIIQTLVACEQSRATAAVVLSCP
jgi:CheY-like chemotaxis protein